MALIAALPTSPEPCFTNEEFKVYCALLRSNYFYLLTTGSEQTVEVVVRRSCVRRNDTTCQLAAE